MECEREVSLLMSKGDGRNSCWIEKGVSLDDFVAAMLARGDELYRDLPWRHVDDPYAVLVSEIMLQQTQVARVGRFWERFLSAFPTVDALAADRCAAEGAGRLPETYEGLLALPGIGPATAAGVVAFAYQRPAVYLETNVRSVFLHELFPEEEAVSDKVLLPLVEAAAFHPAAAADPRRWYYGLLDYGAHLKATVPNPSRRSAGHSRQSAFEGSRRQKRAWITRRVLAAPEGVSRAAVLADLNAAELASGRPEVDPPLFDSIVADLLTEGFFREENDTLTP